MTTSSPCETLTITLRGETHDLVPEPGDTIIQTAYDAGVKPPFSCLAGACATCIAKLVEGTVEMLANDALTPEEVAQGYVLTCQSVPTSARVTVVYEE